MCAFKNSSYNIYIQYIIYFYAGRYLFYRMCSEIIIVFMYNMIRVPIHTNAKSIKLFYNS